MITIHLSISNIEYNNQTAISLQLSTKIMIYTAVKCLPTTVNYECGLQLSAISKHAYNCQTAIMSKRFCIDAKTDYNNR